MSNSPDISPPIRPNATSLGRGTNLVGHVIVDSAPTDTVVNDTLTTINTTTATANDHLAAIRASLNELAFTAILQAERSMFT